MITKLNQPSLSTLRRLEKIFKDKKWLVDNEIEIELFNKFGKMFSFFSEDQQECILELTKQFLRIELPDYYYHLRKCINKICPTHINTTNNFYVLPVNLQKHDFKPTKSSNLIAYFFDDPFLLGGTILKDKNIFVVENPNNLPKNVNNKDCKLILVDDFIGSGETITNCLNFLTELKINLNKVLIITLVIQKHGYEVIMEKNIPIYFSEYRERGINDNYHGDMQERLNKLMVSIEDYLDIQEIERFGRNKTEALVKMCRTPNNTFPVYWRNHKFQEGKEYVSPFTRY